MDLILWRHAEAEDGSPDASRKLTKHGREQAKRVAAWLKPRLPKRCEILASPAVRTQETAAALGARFKTDAAVGTSADAAGLIAAAGWPDRPGGGGPPIGRASRLAYGQGGGVVVAARRWRDPAVYRHPPQASVISACMGCLRTRSAGAPRRRSPDRDRRCNRDLKSAGNRRRPTCLLRR